MVNPSISNLSINGCHVCSLCFSQLWLVVSVELALACVSDGVKRLQHMVVALGASCQYRQLQPAAECFLLQLCTWLSPQGIACFLV
jgi:hypothetical protein